MLYQNHHFSDNFCHTHAAACLDNIATQTSFNLVAMPGVGVTFFLRHLQNRSNDDYIYINSYEMHEFTKQNLYEQLARKLNVTTSSSEVVDLQAIGQGLHTRAAKAGKVILVFNRFDRLGPIIDQNLCDNLRFLQDINPHKIIMVLVTGEPLIGQAREGLKDILSLVTNTTYFSGYTADELCEIVSLAGMKDIEEKALSLAGGHHSLFQILLRCQNLDNALSDPMVELMIKDLYFGLDAKQQKIVESVAAGRTHAQDSFLDGTGYIKTNGEQSQLFTPLLAEYVLRWGKYHLPVKEKRLLELLKRHTGAVVGKQTIFDAVWREDDGIASEWALNALVYRLRHHPAFDYQRYTIESRKKQGYVLHDHYA